MIMQKYAVVSRTGSLRGSYRGAASLYDKESTARNQCRVDGDSVLIVDIDLSREPIFIRRKVLDGG